ncbi:hypothetical protein ACQ4PT_048564 [Festuca glaucescens]
MALATNPLLAPLALSPAPICASQCSLLFLRGGPRAPALLSLRSPRLLAAKEPELGGGGSEGGSGGSGSGGAGGSGDPQGGGEGEGEGLSMSQKLTLAYAALVGAGGVMGYMKSGSQKSLAAGGISALLLFFVHTQLPVRPVFASSIGLGMYIGCTADSHGISLQEVRKDIPSWCRVPSFLCHGRRLLPWDLA